MQLFKSPATLQEMDAGFTCNAKTPPAATDADAAGDDVPSVSGGFKSAYKHHSHCCESPATSSSDSPLCFPQNPVQKEEKKQNGMWFKADNLN